MRRNPEQIEKKAVRVIEDCLENTSRIQTFFGENDKSPIFDGFLAIYDINEGDNRKKEKFYNEIRVQIKGTTKKRIKKSNKYSIDTSDLKGFKQIGGGIYFVVYIDSENQRETIYYRDLLPFDLKDIEDESQNSLTKTFRKLPQDTDGIMTILKTFLADKNKQTPEILSMPLDDLEGKKLSVTFVGNREFIQNNFETLLQQEPMLYYKTDDGVSIPAERIMANSVRSIQEIDAELINGEKLRSYRSLENEDEATINIENFLFFNVDKDNVKIDFTVRKQKTFAKIMTALEKMDDIIANGIKIFNNHFKIGNTKTDDLKTFEEAFNDINDFFKKLDLLFSKIKLDKGLNYFELKNGEKNLLQELVYIFEENLPENPLMRTITLDGNVYYLLISSNNIYNMFYINDKVVVKYVSDGAEHQVVPSLIPRENLDKVVDFDYKQVYQDIENLYTEDNAPNDYVNQYLLDIILTYDRSQNENFYRLADLVSELLIEKDDSVVSKINYLQVIRRKREFSLFERKQLQEMYDESTNPLVKINIKILLRKNVKKDIQMLDESDRENLKSWPIFNLVVK